MEFFKSFMTRLSNGVDDTWMQRKCTDHLIQSGVIQNHIFALEALIKLAFPPINREAIRSVDRAQDDYALVVRNFTTHVFYGAARMGDMVILKLLLHLGILQNNYPNYPYNIVGVTAAQYAMEYQQGQAYNFLLRQNFDVSEQPISELSHSLLWTAIITDIPNAVSELIERGAKDKSRNFKIRMPRRERYLKRLEEDENLLWAKHVRKCNDLELEVKSALQLCALLGRSSSLRALVDCNQNGPNRRYLRSKSGLLYIATSRREHETMETILQCPELTTNVDEEILASLCINSRPTYHTSLAKSIAIGDVEGIRILLAYGGSLDKVKLTGLKGNDLARLQEGQVGESLCQLGLGNLIRGSSQDSATWGINDVLYDASASDSDSSWEGGEWGTVIHNVVQNIPKVLAILDQERLRSSDTPRTQLVIQLCSIFLRSLKFTVAQLVDPPAVGVLVSGMTWNQDTCFGPLKAIERAVDGLSEPGLGLSILGSEEYEVEFIIIAYKNRSITKMIQAIEAFEDKAAEKFELDARRDLTQFCFKESKEQGPFHEVFCPRKGQRLTENLRKLLIRRSGPIDLIFTWALGIQDKSFCKDLCIAGQENLLKLSADQVTALLRLAVRCDFGEIVMSILDQCPSFQVPDTIVCEAVWYADTKTFDDITKHLWGETHCELALFMAISSGQLFKAIRLTAFCDADYEYLPGFRPLDVAVAVGNLDIAKVVLEAGASHGLRESRESALAMGRFSIAELIDQTINTRNLKNSRDIANSDQRSRLVDETPIEQIP
ncbi:hypothetical protein ABW19_dt0200829 [Dactylella cylindrospora]|nr:hypothetical protein ABW19_dt0200829 [Dactylella cylindrospora]